ncbi:MAG: helix-turn-helix domain-containing protein [Actinomycetota bacterium]|nr:helix-turn-helix domain-containing protein [Actinomycetota bacterium]
MPPARTTTQTTTGSRIRSEREAQGLSIEGLSFKAGVSYKTIERIEAGGSEPRRATLKVIADALGKPVEFFDPARVGVA